MADADREKTVLIYNPLFFDSAVHDLDALFPSAWTVLPVHYDSDSDEPNAPTPPSVISEADMVIHRLLCAIDALRVGERSPARQTCLFKGKGIASLHLDAVRDFGHFNWPGTEGLATDAEFPPAPTAMADDAFIQELERHRDVPLFGLCSSEKAVFFYRPPAHPDTLMCSRAYLHQDTDSHCARYVFASAILAALSDLGLCRTSVVFGPLDDIPETPHRLPSSSASTIPSSDGSHTLIELYADVEQSPKPFEKRDSISVVWKPFIRPLHETYMRVPETFMETQPGLRRYIPEDTKIPLAAGAEPDMTVEGPRFSDSVFGYVFPGTLADGQRVVVKVADVRQYKRGPGWQGTAIEAHKYHRLLAAGLAPYIPQFLGLWQGGEITFFVTEDAGKSITEWNELSDAQWEQLCAALRALHRAGFHHGDLFPRNVCCDEVGRVRLVDFGCTIQCRCKQQCIDITDLETDSDRHFIRE